MALLTAAELKASREAIQAKVNTVSDADANAAIADAEVTLYSALGYDIESSATELTVHSAGGGALVLPQRIRSLSAIEDEDGNVLESTGYRGAGFVVTRYYGWTNATDYTVTGTFGYTSSDSQWKLAKRAVKLLAVRYLQSTATGGLPSGAPGAFLTGYSSESASFTFFTPSGEEDGTGFADVDRIVKQIGRHPYKSSRVLKSVPVRSTGYGVGTDL